MWVRHLRKQVGSLPIALVAAKADLDEEAAALWQPGGPPITREGKDHVNQVNGTDLVFVVSAKLGQGVFEVIEALVDIVSRRENVLGYQLKAPV